MMTDPIADMLTRVRNAGTAGHRWVDMPPSKLKIEVAKLLKESHFIFDWKSLDDGKHGVLRLYLKYHDGAPIIRNLKRVSRPGRRHYVGASDVPQVRNGMGIAILSTSQGLMTDRSARRAGVGGEVMALVW